jgi:hypothetical protein
MRKVCLSLPTLSAAGTVHASAVVRQKSKAVAKVATVVFSAIDSCQSCRCAGPLGQWCYTLFWPSSFLCYLNFKRFFHRSLGKSFGDWMSSQMSQLIGLFPLHHYCSIAKLYGIYLQRL